MAVISMDANDRADSRRPPRQRSFRQRNAVASDRVGSNREPTGFGKVLLEEMNAAGLTRAELARRAGTGASTITRIILGEVQQPDDATLARLARALVEARTVPGTSIADLGEAVGAMHDKLMLAAGYRSSAVRPVPDAASAHPLVIDLQRLIGADSPLPADDVRYLEDMITRLVDPYRSKLRKRSA